MNFLIKFTMVFLYEIFQNLLKNNTFEIFIFLFKINKIYII